MRILLKGLGIHLKSLCEIALLKLLIARVLKRYLCCIGKGNEEVYCEIIIFMILPKIYVLSLGRQYTDYMAHGKVPRLKFY